MHAFPKSILCLVLFVALLASMSCSNSNTTSPSETSNNANIPLNNVAEYPPLPSTNGGAPTKVLTEEETLEKWAGSYAEYRGISKEDALRQFYIEEEEGPLQAEIRRHESETFAGLWIQHEPEFRIVVAFTSGGTETLHKYLGDTPLSEVIEVRNANLSIVELDAIRHEVQQIIELAGIPFESASYLQRNKIEIYVLNHDEVFTALANAEYSLPDAVSIIQVEGFSVDD